MLIAVFVDIMYLILLREYKHLDTFLHVLWICAINVNFSSKMSLKILAWRTRSMLVLFILMSITGFVDLLEMNMNLHLSELRDNLFERVHELTLLKTMFAFLSKAAMSLLLMSRLVSSAY